MLTLHDRGHIVEFENFDLQVCRELLLLFEGEFEFVFEELVFTFQPLRVVLHVDSHRIEAFLNLVCDVFLLLAELFG